MPDQEEIIKQQDLLVTYRRTLGHLCKQAAQYGGESSVPPNVANGIYEARRNIQQIKDSLRSWGLSIEDLPEDQALAEDTAITTVSSPQQISQGLFALIGLLHAPQVRTATVTFRADFEVICEHIKVVNYYKRLHDLFQDLETSYYVIEFDRQRLSDDTDTWESLALHEPEVQGAIEDLLNTAGLAVFVSSSAWWVQQLTQTHDDLHTAVDAMNAALLVTALRRLYHVLDREPSRINTRLVAAADALRLNVLITAMTTVRDSISTSLSATIAAQHLNTSIEALTQLNTSLRSHVSNHQFWQDIDDELRRVDANMVQDASEFALTWPDLKVMAMKLCEGNTGEWVIALQRIGGDLEGALTIRASDKIRRLFRQYRSCASRRFRQVDQELVELCQDLEKIGYALSMLLSALE